MEGSRFGVAPRHRLHKWPRHGLHHGQDMGYSYGQDIGDKGGDAEIRVEVQTYA
jgi:hypothetical protein